MKYVNVKSGVELTEKEFNEHSVTRNLVTLVMRWIVNKKQ